jgi:hypothetical protein
VRATSNAFAALFEAATREAALRSEAEILRHLDSERRATISTLAVEPAAIATLYGDGIARRVFEGAAKIEVRRP